MIYAFRLFCLFSALLFPAISIAGQPVTVFAAASLRGALDEVAAASGQDVILSYGGSGQIARQVAQGAPADVVLLANRAWMDWLEGRGLIAADKRFDLLGNRLVLIGSAGASPLSVATAETILKRLDGGHLAIGQTSGVPSGIYGRQWLENAGLWPGLAPHLAETENVRAALALVSRGEAPMGLVYTTDARADPGVVTIYDIPMQSHEPIAYPVAIIEERITPQATEFMEFIRSNEAMDIFRDHGFASPGGRS